MLSETMRASLSREEEEYEEEDDDEEEEEVEVEVDDKGSDPIPLITFNRSGASFRGVRSIFVIMSRDDEQEGAMDMATTLLSLDL